MRKLGVRTAYLRRAIAVAASLIDRNRRDIAGDVAIVAPDRAPTRQR